MLGLVEWMVTLIVVILLVGFLYWILKRVLALVEAPPKIQEGVLLIVLLVVALFAAGFVLTGNFQPLFRFR